MGGSGRPSNYDRPTRSSGSGGGGGGGGGDGGQPSDPCDISVTVDLTGLDSKVLTKVASGTVLNISIVKAGAYEAVACTLPPKNDTVGTLAAIPGLANLIACIKKKNVYVADVQQVGRGQCTVTVHRK